MLQKQDLKPLTSLRFFAAAAIVLFHMKFLPWDRIGVLSHGVSFFFVLSGFILTHVYGRDFGLRSFYRNRFARLWPLHVVCLGIFIAVLPAPDVTRPAWFLSLLSNITLLQAWIPLKGFPFGFNAVSWSISTEIAFYLAFPLLVRSNRFWLLYALLVVGVILILGVLQAATSPLSGGAFSFRPQHIILQSPYVRILDFATGVAAGRIFLTRNWPTLARWQWTALEVGIVSALVTYWHSVHPVVVLLRRNDMWAFAAWWNEASGMFLYAGTILLFAMSAGYVAKALSHRWLVVLGEASFATYLIHQIILRYVTMHWSDLDWRIAAPLSLLAIYAASFALWLYIEKPARKMIVQGAPLPGRYST